MFAKCRWFGVVLGALALTGCLQQKIVVQVNPDGSGKVVLSRYFTPEGVAMVEASMKQMEEAMSSGEFGGMGGSPVDNPFFNEAAAEAQAALFGPHAKFEKAVEIKKNGNRGFAAVYSFDDVNELHVPFELQSTMMVVSMGMMGGQGMGMALDDILEMTGGSAAEFIMSDGQLKIKLPSFVANPPKTVPTNSLEELSSDENMEMVMAMSMMGPGMGGAAGNPQNPQEAFDAVYGSSGFSLAVQLKGAKDTLQVSHPDKNKKNRFTLYELDFSQLGKALPGLMANGSMFGQDGNMLDELNGYPGVVLETNETVTIEFEPVKGDS